MGSIFGSINSETPKYELMETTDFYEIRKYKPSLQAEVIMETSDMTSGDGFRALAGYIFGDNSFKDDSSVKIAMTAPVITESLDFPMETESKGGKTKMAFVLPSKYEKIEDLPVPKNSNVVLKENAERKFAVHKFSGSVNSKDFEEKERLLKEALAKNGVSVSAERAVLWRYNPPWCLPGYRTNEIAVELK